ncbi:MAG: sigma factor [Bacillota bacterium]|nr:sigma factor [Bacillota bacterium]
MAFSSGIICKRHLNWGEDDELSIAFLAFNEAIDNFNVSYRVPFLAYARLVIKSRLIDYFRREARERSSTVIGLDSEVDLLPGEEEQAWERFVEELAAREREEELLQYEEELKTYGLELDDLVRTSPKHRDSRELLQKIARTLAGDGELFRYLQDRKRLPVQALSKLGKVSPKTLEGHRAYIIGLALIYSKSEEYLYLASYLKPCQAPGS